MKTKFAIGCLVQWYECDIIEEYVNSLKDALDVYDGDVLVDFLICANQDLEKCINDKKIEDYVLNDRIEGTKKFEIDSTPTIIINGKKFEKTLNYKNLKKSLEKLI